MHAVVLSEYQEKKQHENLLWLVFKLVTSSETSPLDVLLVGLVVVVLADIDNRLTKQPKQHLVYQWCDVFGHVHDS